MKTRRELLESFIVPEDTQVKHVYIDSIPEDAPERYNLVGYHPGDGGDFKVFLEIQGPKDDEFLKIIPDERNGVPWESNCKNFLDKLEFIPVPDKLKVPGRPISLVVRKRIIKSGYRIGNTGWHLGYCCIGKMQIGEKSSNEVIMVWENDKYEYYAASCWKW